MAPNAKTRLLYENDDVERIGAFEKKGYRSKPILFVNGKKVPDDLASKARSNQTLLSFLREDMMLTGSKLGCAEGGCGACTVMISKKDVMTGEIKHYNVNACLMPVLAADGCHVTTVEGVGTVKGDKMHPIQKAMTELHGSQCGFCTPGIIVSIYSLYANRASMKEIEEHLDGNLCRCTGYRPIWDAARSLCDDAEHLVHGPCGTPCRECPERNECEQDCNVQDKQEEAEKDEVVCSTTKDKVALKNLYVAGKTDWLEQPDQLFPKELVDLSSSESMDLSKPLMVVDKTEFQGAGTWFKPSSLEDLLLLLKDFGDPAGGGYKIVVGNTEVGIETKFKHAVYPRLIYPSDSIRELYQFSAGAEIVTIGACTPLSTIQHEFGKMGKDPTLARTLLPVHDMLRWFASTQIRNVACLGGNLVTASPISDMNPMLACMGAKLILSRLGSDGNICRRSKNASEFFVKYRTVDIDSTEMVEKIEVPILSKVFEYVKPFKQARRREDDISIVTSGMKIQLEPNGGKFIIKSIALAFGGMAPKTVMASATANSMIGSTFCRQTFSNAQSNLIEELSLPEDVPGGQAAYRMTLASSFLFKFYISVSQELKKDIDEIVSNPSAFESISEPLPELEDLSKEEISGADNFLSSEKPSFSGSQTYPAPKVASGLEDKMLPNVSGVRQASAASAVGKGSVHQSGPLHCTGEALYTDDIPPPPGTLHGALILAKQCNVIFESIDVESGYDIPGVVKICTATDIDTLGGKNELGPIAHDETIFLPPGETVAMVGQVLGIVVAETLESAEMAARMISITYGKSHGEAVMSIENAIEANSFYESTRHKVTRGDVSFLENIRNQVDTEGAMVGDIVKVSGTFHSGAQEHFYLETNSTLVVPSESDTNLTIYCSTQAADKTQKFCASSTGTPAAKVVCRVKRLGGGFGGKETRSVFASCAAAVAAKCTSRPVRLTLARNVDMLTTGQRHAFLSKYCASAKVTEDGAKILSMDVQVFNNGGAALDLSGPVADRALFHIDNAYMFPSLRVEVVSCRTAQAPHTAYRGFGGPQGMVIAEHVIEHLALACRVPVDKMRRDNLYKDGDSTHFGMILGAGGSNGKWNVPKMYDMLYKELDIPKRRASIEKFNSENKWLKRGCALIPTKFGIAFTAKFMNQGGALVHLYTDGTVLVSHGGTEMGQGLHTKVCQIAAQAFGIPVEHVYVNDSSTDKVANTMPTAASMSTDLYGMCTLDACRQILGRLKPIREKLGHDASLAEIAVAAHMERIDLSAHGFYAPDGSRIGYDFFKEKPSDFPSDAPENSFKGHPFNYFTQGVAYTEVEIDVLTGNHRTLFSDVVVDVGSSVNPAIDIGQIEGAFTQGMGWSTMEDVIYGDDDHTWVRPRSNIFTAGPGTYKLPAFNDQPEVFNVSLLEDVDNPFAVHSSKAVGEPPFYLGTSVFYAIKDAVRSARRENAGGNENYFEMRLPATSERIRMYVNDEISMKAKTLMFGGNVEKAAAYQPQGSY